MTRILGATYKSILMFFGTSHIVSQWQYFNDDPVDIVPHCDKSTSCFKMSQIFRVDTSTILLPYIRPLLVRTVGINNLKEVGR